MNHKPEIEIKIYGGTNMIAPVATTAVQNFYGDRFAEVALHAEVFDVSGLLMPPKFREAPAFPGIRTLPAILRA